MFSATSKRLMEYVGKTKLEQIADPAWLNSGKAFCEKFEKEVSRPTRTITLKSEY